jgi:hypothetical protein
MVIMTRIHFLCLVFFFANKKTKKKKTKLFQQIQFVFFLNQSRKLIFFTHLDYNQAINHVNIFVFRMITICPRHSPIQRDDKMRSLFFFAFFLLFFSCFWFWRKKTTILNQFYFKKVALLVRSTMLILSIWCKMCLYNCTSWWYLILPLTTPKKPLKSPKNPNS